MLLNYQLFVVLCPHQVPLHTLENQGINKKGGRDIFFSLRLLFCACTKFRKREPNTERWFATGCIKYFFTAKFLKFYSESTYTGLGEIGAFENELKQRENFFHLSVLHLKADIRGNRTRKSKNSNFISRAKIDIFK